MKIHKNSVVAIITFSIILLIILSIILPKFPIFVVKRTFNYATQNIVNISGLSHWLVKGILVFVLIPFYWALLEITKLNMHLFSRKKSYRKLAKFVIVSYAGLFFLGMFFLSRGTYFAHTPSDDIVTPLKYYAETPEGIRFFDSPGFDPKYGIELKPVTPEMMAKYQKKALGLQPKKIQIQSVKDFEFFDPITGETKIWYFLDNQGNYEFFSGPGFHPAYNEELMPVTAVIIKNYQRSLDAKRASEAEDRIRLAKEAAKKDEAKEEQRLTNYLGKYMNLSVVNQPGSKDIAVLIVDESSNERPDIEGDVAKLLREKELVPILSYFNFPFIREGMFETIFSGETGKIKDLQMERGSDYIVLGKVFKKYKSNPQLQNVISADIILEIKIFSTENGSRINSSILTVTGAGFSEQEAEKRALELISGKLAKFLNESGI